MKGDTNVDILEQLKGKFRILKDVEVLYCEHKEISMCCNVSNSGEMATIYTYDPNSECSIEEYLLHELLHICVGVIRKTEYPDWKEKEELFVQDLTNILKCN